MLSVYLEGATNCPFIAILVLYCHSIGEKAQLAVVKSNFIAILSVADEPKNLILL